LFSKSGYTYHDKDRYFILEKGKEWDKKYKTASEIGNEDIFVQYLDFQKKNAELYTKNKEKYDNISINFDIEFEKSSRYIKTIKNKN
jgi:hypothetical protein